MSSDDGFTFEAENLDGELAAYNDAIAFAETLEASSLGSPDAQTARWAGAEILLEHRGPLPPHRLPSARCQPSTLSLARHVADRFDNRGRRGVGTLWRIVATVQAARLHATDDAEPVTERTEGHGGENIPESKRCVTIGVSGAKRALAGAAIVLAALLLVIQLNSPTVPDMASNLQHALPNSVSEVPLMAAARPARPDRIPVPPDWTLLDGLDGASGLITDYGPRGQDFVRPVYGPVAVAFGTGSGGIRESIDITIGVNEWIYAVADSTVEESGPVSELGMWIVLRHTDGTRSVYGRINRSLVNVGDMVTAGEQIAEVDKRDTSTAPHLHFEIRHIRGMKIDPLAWLNERGIGY